MRKVTELGRKHSDRASSLVRKYLQDAYETGTRSLTSRKPEVMKSGKWTESRYLDALMRVGLQTEERPLLRKMAVKPNEALSKEKPRGISTGDKGVMLHCFDPPKKILDDERPESIFHHV